MSYLMSRWHRTGRASAGLLLCEAMTTLAQMVAYVTVPWWITTHGGASHLAMYGIAQAGATLVCAPLAAPFGDQWGKQRQISLALAALVAISAALAVLAWQDRYDIALVALISAASVLASAFLNAALGTVSLDIVTKEQLPDIMALQKAAQAFGRVGGPVLGGLLIAVGGVNAGLAAAPFLLAVAAVSSAFIPRLNTPATRPPFSWKDDLKAGLIAKWSIPLERGWLLLNFVVWIFLGPAVTLLIPLKIQSMGLSGAWLGAAEAMLSVGMLIGALVGPDLFVRAMGRFNARWVAGASEGLFLLTVGLVDVPAWTLAGLFCCGFANSMLTLIGQTHRALAVPKEFRVRLGSVNVTFTQVANLIGPALAALAVEHFGVKATYAGFGLFASLCAGCFVLLPRGKEFLSLSHEEATDWLAREYPEVFGSQSRVFGKRSAPAPIADASN